MTIRCCKCSGLGTRAHHRACDKRGAGHLGRGERVRWTEMFAAEWNVLLRIRRGRGPGVSLSVARRRLLAIVNGGRRGTPNDIAEQVAAVLSCDPRRVTVERAALGHIRVTVPRGTGAAALARADRCLSSIVPVGVSWVVEGGALALGEVAVTGEMDTPWGRLPILDLGPAATS